MEFQTSFLLLVLFFSHTVSGESKLSIAINHTVVSEIRVALYAYNMMKQTKISGSLTDGKSGCTEFPPPNPHYNHGNFSFIIIRHSKHCDFTSQALSAMSHGYDVVILEFKRNHHREISLEPLKISKFYLILFVLSDDASELQKLSQASGLSISYTESSNSILFHILPVIVVISGISLVLMTIGGAYGFKLIKKYLRRIRSERRILSLPSRLCVQADVLDECPICLDDYHINDRLTILHCGHEFHQKCLKCGTIVNCPLCREPIFKSDEDAYTILPNSEEPNTGSCSQEGSTITDPLISTIGEASEHDHCHVNFSKADTESKEELVL